MGYGDAGLTRAKQWGVQTVTAKIVIPSAPVTLQFGKSSLGNIGNLYVEPESGSGAIEKMQEILTKADIYNGDINGDYESVKDDLIDFQIEQGIVKDSEDWGAGYFGNKTIAALSKIYGETIPLVPEDDTKFESFNHVATSEKYKTILDYGDLQTTPDSPSEDIMDLERLFTDLGEYHGKIDGNYNSIAPVLIALQVKV